MGKQPNGSLRCDQAIDLAWVYIIVWVFGIFTREIFIRMLMVNIKNTFAKYDILKK
jgi:hypothetical protein